MTNMSRMITARMNPGEVRMPSTVVTTSFQLSTRANKMSNGLSSPRNGPQVSEGGTLEKKQKMMCKKCNWSISTGSKMMDLKTFLQVYSAVRHYIIPHCVLFPINVEETIIMNNCSQELQEELQTSWGNWRPRNDHSLDEDVSHRETADGEEYEKDDQENRLCEGGSPSLVGWLTVVENAGLQRKRTIQYMIKRWSHITKRKTVTAHG